MIYLLAQAQEVAQSLPAESRLFGLTIAEWVLLLGALGTFVEVLRQRHKHAKTTGEKIDAENVAKSVAAALGEVLEAHPEAVRLTRRIAKDKATKLGVKFDQLQLLDSDGDGIADADELKKEGPK